MRNGQSGLCVSFERASLANPTRRGLTGLVELVELVDLVDLVDLIE